MRIAELLTEPLPVTEPSTNLSLNPVPDVVAELDTEPPASKIVNVFQTSLSKLNASESIVPNWSS